MRVLTVPLFQRWPPHAAADLEIMTRHVRAGHEVWALECGARASACVTNPESRLADCAGCVGAFVASLDWLDGEVHRLPLLALDPHDVARVRECRVEFDSLDDLMAYRFEGFDLGYAVVSTIVTMTREPRPDISERGPMVARLARTAAGAFLSTLRLLQRQSFDLVYVFNGRFAIARAVLRACEQVGVPFVTHDRGRDLQHFAEYPGGLPHDRELRARMAHEAWRVAAADPVERERVARHWFEQRERGVELNWHSFAKNQQAGRLPREWDPSKKNVVIFNSSEDEFVAIGEEWSDGIYETQIDGILRLADAFADDPERQLYLRIHPNLATVENSQTRGLLSLSHPALNIIPAASKISSYALIDASDCILTFGSTVGMEALVRGTPATSLGPTFYDGLGQDERPRTHEEAVAWVRNPPRHVDELPALILGYFQATLGTRFEHFEPSGVHDGTWDGHPMEPGRRARLLRFALGSRYTRGLTLWAAEERARRWELLWRRGSALN